MYFTRLHTENGSGVVQRSRVFRSILDKRASVRSEFDEQPFCKFESEGRASDVRLFEVSLNCHRVDELVGELVSR